jgi:hypothetical protein
LRLPTFDVTDALAIGQCDLEEMRSAGERDSYAKLHFPKAAAMWLCQMSSAMRGHSPLTLGIQVF